ncbi:B12-binding domain-containing radical SAM protein [Catellatospora methionotrophica]|uniref:B12-binding domain-containing radical SAM protein n=1 Tax=Catellatospora methionotrophica TaxID=121620 RepID=UPI0033D0D5FB
MLTPKQRLANALQLITDLSTADALAGLDDELTQPMTAVDQLRTQLPSPLILTGTQDHRLLIAQRPASDDWVLAELSGRPLHERRWPTWATDQLDVADPRRDRSLATITPEGQRRLLRPKILITALYHKETFPLPRFPLAISDLARAARSTLSGQVRLMDMQLGVSLEQVLAAVDAERPDIVGISATFGQHDLMTELLDQLFALPEPPLVLAGGSLTARNERLLLEHYPRLLVARGAGEPTIADIIAYFHGDIDLGQVNGIGYAGAPHGGGLQIAVRRNAVTPNRDQTDFLPELDLLSPTFAHHGVAQLEASRGCTNFCSFCPRGHKGIWAGPDGSDLPWLLQTMSTVFDRHPDISRTLYLVDEEFIGRGDGVVDRALSLGRTLHAHGYRWESSCRVDQVVLPDQSRQWHIERAQMWRQLVDYGLRRMLFGVESGVDSILTRFNKETTGDQNALAIRTLTALGVPPRFTYITFDHLMTADELAATHAFQGRTDLLLRPLPHLSAEQIVDGVRDEEFVVQHSTGKPFYSAVSYLLVSMECLIGAAYTKQVAQAGLAGAVRPSMGRVDAGFADWRIGRASHHAQLWVDRNFALDYTFKSLEKILDGAAYHAVRAARVVIKTAAFDMLGRMLDLISQFPLQHPDEAALDARLRAAMDSAIAAMAEAMDKTVADTAPQVPASARQLMVDEHARWRTASGWQLINAAESCGN